MNKEQEITLLYQLIEKHFGSGALMQFEDLTETDNDQLLNRIEIMDMYPTYESAKIKHPECDIYEHNCTPMGKLFTPGLMHSVMDGSYNNKCNPADHCMTVEKFLANGHKFVEGKGDAYLDNKGVVRLIGDNGYSAWGCNDVTYITNSQESFILRAAALEDKSNLGERSNMPNKKDLFGTIFNVANDDESANIRQAGLFYDVCKAYGIKVMGGNGRDHFMSAVGGGLVNLCIGNDNGSVFAFGRSNIPDGAVFGGSSISMSEFKYITESHIRSYLDNLNSTKESKRTKVKYVKAVFDSAWEAIKSYEINDDLYYCASSTPTYEKMKAGNMKNLLDYSMPVKLYRKIETPIE